MQEKLVDNISFKINCDKLLNKLKINYKQDIEKFKGMLSEAEKIARPRGLYRECFISEKGEDYVIIAGYKFKSRVLRVNLDKAQKVFPYIVTVGQELEEWATSKEDFLEQYWAEEIEEEILRQAIDKIYKMIKKYLPGEKSSEMNPGSLRDWPIGEQAKLFSLFSDVEKAIGVRLTESYLILPKKSVSGFKFPTEVNFKNCQLCPRDNCSSRRAPYNKELWETKYK